MQHQLWRRLGRIRSSSWVKGHAYVAASLFVRRNPDGQIDGEAITYLDKMPFPDEFVREADHFSSCIFEDRQPGPSGEEGLRDMECIDRIYKSAAAQS